MIGVAYANPGVQMGGQVKSTRRPRTPAISDRFVLSAIRRLEQGKSLRRPLQPWGRVHIERQLPFLISYRRPGGRDDPETHRLVLGEASYLLAPGDRKYHRKVAELVRGVAEVFAREFGAFLLIEVWAGEENPDPMEGVPERAGFRIVRQRGCRLQSTVDVLDWGLGEIRVKGSQSEVEVENIAKVTPPSMLPLLTPSQTRDNPWYVLGLEVRPVFRDLPAGQDFPLVQRVLHRGIARALKRGIFEFARKRTSQRPAHYHALGRQRVVNAVWAVDRQLAEVSNTFDFLLQVTPVNTDEAWSRFRRLGYQVLPEFLSRPLPVDPATTKRRLFEVPIESIEDPTLAQLFRDQQAELDRKLTMLGDRGTSQFLYGSLALYGGVEEGLLSLANDILERIPPRTRDESHGSIGAREFAGLAEEHVEQYRALHPELSCKVEVREDIVGLMVSRGSLLVGTDTKVPRSRIEALLAHEVGTHVVTYVNGGAQPFRQLYIGLPGYDELQEGLAVLAEYLVGGLSRPRLRLLAARVLATHKMVDGADFIEVFRELVRIHEFARRAAFNITMRIFRGGGLTKDAVYLRGLVALLEYLQRGGRIDPLIVGKVGLNHIPVIEELNWRKVLEPPLLRPRYLDDPVAANRLTDLKKGVTVMDLIK